MQRFGLKQVLSPLHAPLCQVLVQHTQLVPDSLNDNDKKTKDKIPHAAEPDVQLLVVKLRAIVQLLVQALEYILLRHQSGQVVF